MTNASRRTFLRGAGVALSLPMLEGLHRGHAHAGSADIEPYAIFFRQANGVQTALDDGPIGSEPERFWPRQEGALTPEGVDGRALDELTPWLAKLLVVGNVNLHEYEYGDGHAQGAFQGLTAVGPTQPNRGASSEAAGESLDHRIGRELNPNGNDPWFLHAGATNGYLGGPCISYQGPGNRAAPITSPLAAYALLAGAVGEDVEALILRQRGVNDLVMREFDALLADPVLSRSDQLRLEQHRDSIRDLETNLGCMLADAAVAEIEDAQAPGGEPYSVYDGDQVLRVVRAHMQVAAIAVSCGYTRAVAIQIGNGLDNYTIYRHPTTGADMENFHYLSHRRQSGTNEGPLISGSDLLHHYVDRHHAQTYRYLLELLEAYQLPSGGTLLDAGLAIWYNDLATGPGHGIRGVPWVIGGSAGGFLQQGQYVRIGGDGPNASRVLNTVGAAVGLRSVNGDELDDFGDTSVYPRGTLPELRA